MGDFTARSTPTAQPDPFWPELMAAPDLAVPYLFPITSVPYQPDFAPHDIANESLKQLIIAKLDHFAATLTTQNAKALARQFYIELGLAPTTLADFKNRCGHELWNAVLKQAFAIADELLAGVKDFDESFTTLNVVGFLRPLVQLTTTDGQIYAFPPGDLYIAARGADYCSYAKKQGARVFYDVLRRDLQFALDGQGNAFAGLLTGFDLKHRGACYDVVTDSYHAPDVADVADVTVGEQGTLIQPLQIQVSSGAGLGYGTPVFATWEQMFGSIPITITADAQDATGLTVTLSAAARVFADSSEELKLSVTDGYSVGGQILPVTVQNNINEPPTVQITQLKDRTSTGQGVLAKATAADDNGDDTQISWSVLENGVEIFTQQGAELQLSPSLLPGQKTTLTFVVTANDGHSQNNLATAQKNLTLSAPNKNMFQRQTESRQDLEDIQKIFGGSLTEVNTGVDPVQPVLEALKTQEQNEVYEILFLVDASGSMGTVAAILGDRADAILQEHLQQVPEGGRIKVGVAYYGNSQTHVVYSSDWTTHNTDSSQNLKAVIQNFTQAMQTVKTAIGSYGLETVWHSLWDLTVGPHRQSFATGQNKKTRFIILSDYEVDARENEVAVGSGGTKVFSREAATALIQSQGIELKIVRFVPTPDYKKIAWTELQENLSKPNPFALEPLIQALGDKDEFVRGGAAIALGNLGDACAVDPLIKALEEDEFVDVRWVAASALGKLGDARAVEPLIKALGDENAYVRIQAASVLGELGEARGVEPLIKALGDEDAHVRRDAALALGELGDMRGVEPLIKALEDDEDAHVRSNAALALGELGDARAVDPLIKALEDKKLYVRRDAAVALGEFGDARAVDLFMKALGDKDVRVRMNAAEALGDLGDARAVELLIKALGDKDQFVRGGAAIALGNLGDACAVDPLIKALEDKDSYVCNRAVFALGQIKNKKGQQEILARYSEDKKTYLPGIAAMNTVNSAKILIKALTDADVELVFLADRELKNTTTENIAPHAALLQTLFADPTLNLTARLHVAGLLLRLDPQHAAATQLLLSTALGK